MRRWLPTVLATVLVAVFAWQFVLPPTLGGRTALVVAEGNSMEPGIKRGDLVVVRKSSNPSVKRGDVVLYRSAALNRWVLHRVVKVEASGQFVTKGDNNSFLDSDKINPSDLIGMKILTIPGGGKIAGSYTVQLLTGLIGLISLGLWAFINARNRRQISANPPLKSSMAATRHHLPPQGQHEDSQATSTYAIDQADHSATLRAGPNGSAARRGVAIGLVVLGLVGAGILWKQSTAKRPPVEITVTGPKLAGSFTHTGELSYTATESKKAIQPDGIATTGDALFPASSGPVKWNFKYQLEGDETELVLGKGQLRMVVTDQAGWKFEEVLARGVVRGGELDMTGTLNLKALVKRVEKFQSASGTSPAQYNINIVPTITFAKSAPKALQGNTFDPSVTFVLDGRRFRPALIDGGDAASQFRPAETIEGDQSAKPKNARSAAQNVPRNVYKALALAALIAGAMLALLVWPAGSSKQEDSEDGEGSEHLFEELDDHSTFAQHPRHEVVLEPLAVYPMSPPNVVIADGHSREHVADENHDSAEDSKTSLVVPIPSVVGEAGAQQRHVVTTGADVGRALERVDAFVVDVPRVRISPDETVVHLTNPLELAAAAARSDKPVVRERGHGSTRWVVRLGRTCLVLTLVDSQPAYEDRAA